MADGGVMMGLPRALAVEHAAATVRGAATMVMQVRGGLDRVKDFLETVRSIAMISGIVKSRPIDSLTLIFSVLFLL